MQNEEYLYKVIRAPHSSEKSVRAADRYGQYVFKVLRQANKKDIKKAVELLFKVDVTQVHITNLRTRKIRNMRTGKMMKKTGYKKAYVTLEKGQQINFVAEAS